jgi:hypothetical protein
MNLNPMCDGYSGQPEGANNFRCRLVVLSVDQLRPHPSYTRHQLSVSASQLTAILALGSLAFLQPIMVTQEGIVLDGYARWELARQQGRKSLLCLEFHLSEEESLRCLVLSHRPSPGFNGYCRSLLALDLEPSLQEKARSNQRIGGQSKGLSNLTEAKKVDVRSEIAGIADVSTGNLTKAKRLVSHADPVIQEAAKSGEIRVHRAWQWSRLSHHHQAKKLEGFRSWKGVGLVSRKLIQKHALTMRPTRLIPPTLANVLQLLSPDHMAVLDAIVVSEIDAPGRIAYFTKGAIGVLRSLEEPECKTTIY